MHNTPPPRLGLLPSLIFSSRWLQLPLYLGLIVAQGVYVMPVSYTHLTLPTTPYV